MEAAFLRKVSIFANLSEKDLEYLNSKIVEKSLAEGEYLFHEGDPAGECFIIGSGQLEVLKSAEDRQVLLAIRDQGEVIGEISLFQDNARTATIRARRDSILHVIDKTVLDEMMSRSPNAAHSIIRTIIGRWNSTEALLKNNEKMAQLGTLTAGMAHELNNPAAAIARSASSLEHALDEFFDIEADIDKLDLQVNKRDLLQSLRSRVKASAKAPPVFDSLERSDLEYEMEELLEEFDIADSYQYAPTLVNLKFTESDITKLSEDFDPDEFGIMIKWLEKSYQVYALQNEISEGANRVSAIVKALKGYSYLDQAPLQEVDIHEGLDNTLLILRNKLKYGIDVKKNYSHSIPKIQAYGSELNQVWTNLLDNAADALQENQEGDKKITISTKLKTDWVIVEIIDNGPGIPDHVKEKIFNPFFTTKPPGKGTGLGLDISYNIITEKHHGDIKVISRPGYTCFQVYLPIDLDRIQGKSVMDEFIVPADEKLLNILDNTKSIVVIKYLDDPNSAAHTIPYYLKERNFTVYAISDNLKETVDDIPIFQSLDDIHEDIDLALIFESGSYVTSIVQKVIDKGIKYIWMNEGVINEEAALQAVASGLSESSIVMDTCIRVTHSRLKE